jgi:alkylation response protein AidB-like acyl-CoA dehydrogenase
VTAVEAPIRPGSPELDDLLEKIGAGAFDRELKDERPFEAYGLIRGARLGALRIPLADGGGGASVRELFEVLIRLAESDPNLAHALRSHFTFVEGRLRAQDPKTRTRWLTRVVAGELFGDAVTERSANDVGATRVYETKLNPSGDEWILDGTKYYTTGTLFAQWVVARGSRPEPDNDVVTVVVPTDRQGVTVIDDWDGIGQRLTASGTTKFDNVTVNNDELILVSAAERALPSHLGAFAQLWLTAVIAGILRSAAGDSVALVKNRKRGYSHAVGATPAQDPLLQEQIGEIGSAAWAAEAIVLAAADALTVAEQTAPSDPNAAQLAHLASLRAAEAKVIVDRLALAAANRVFDVGGASATDRSLNLDRHWRNIRTLASHNPTVYKAQAVGNHLGNGERLPQNAFF